MSRIVSTLALALFLAACQTAASPPAPSPSPGLHNTVATAVIQPGEVPASLSKCPGSGPITGYLTALQASNPALAQQVTDQWRQLQAKGAKAAAIMLFAYDPTACSAELAATASTKSLASFVVQFSDEGQAERAWGAGVLGFATPSPDQVAPGILRGSGTGLGDSSWTYNNPQVQLACWRRSVFVSLVVLNNLDAAAYKAVTVAIDARLN
ncbi:MAG TPA: hypothetical protein VHW94_09305 [Candidatus Dormibacteraeota bacterium]|nr:hypothetical protein [Candidatus Dormibacteraeota bacterium]